MITAADTNVLLDVLLPDPEYGESSAQHLAEAWRDGALVICDAVYAELAGWFTRKDDLDRFLAGTAVKVEAAGEEALHLAGQAWRMYSERRPTLLTCSRCGSGQDVRCRQCGAAVRPRQHIVADFIIGAHATLRAERLLTRDAGYYRTYFPSLTLA